MRVYEPAVSAKFCGLPIAPLLIVAGFSGEINHKYQINMNNPSALDRLKEIEAEKREIEAVLIAEKGNVEFPIYCKHKELNNYYKIISRQEYVKIDLSGGSYDSSVEHLKYFGTTTTMIWDYYWQDKTESITPEEFEAARAEVIQKLSNL